MPIRTVLSHLADTIANAHPGLKGRFGDAIDSFFARRMVDQYDQVVFNADDRGSIIRHATGTITNAEALALRATPKVLVTAPGAGLMLVFVGITLHFDYTGAYTETADNLAVRYTGTTGVLVSQAIEATGFVDATADTVTNGLPKIDAIAAKSASENKPLVLHNTGDGEFGGGNAANKIRYSVQYRIVPTGF